MQPTIKKKNFFFKSLDRVGLFLGSLLQRSPVPGPQSSTDSKSVRNKTTQQQESSKRVNKASPAAPHSSRYRLNHIPPHSTEKMFSLKLIPGVKNVRHHCSILFHWLICLSLCQYHTVLIARESIWILGWIFLLLQKKKKCCWHLDRDCIGYIDYFGLLLYSSTPGYPWVLIISISLLRISIIDSLWS